MCTHFFDPQGSKYIFLFLMLHLSIPKENFAIFQIVFHQYLACNYHIVSTSTNIFEPFSGWLVLRYGKNEKIDFEALKVKKKHANSC